MKKFGTPIGAGPGNANENVGLTGVGIPLGVRSAPGDFGLEAAGVLPAPVTGFEPTEPGEDV